jgi:predicted alpha/beta-hydrolase family hydrolase
VRVDVETPGGPARVDLNRPPSAVALLTLTHGAAGGVETADLLAIRTAASAAGIAVALITQPFRVAGRRTPPAPRAQDEAWLAIVTAMGRRVRRVPVVVGGRSNGARVACRTAAATGAAGVVALAFPLHPPGRPDNSRLPELDLPTVPVLVVQGDRDPFGMPPPGAGRIVHVIAGADHSLRKNTAATAAAVVEFVTTLARHANVGA